MNENLSAHYKTMWEEARKEFVQGKCVVDDLILSAADDRRGLTLLARPDQRLKGEIFELQSNLKQLLPNQYFQPSSDLHLTILSIISCYSGFNLNQVDHNLYAQLIEECTSGSIRIRFSGVTASASAILIKGYPEGNGLDDLRQKLRVIFKDSGLLHSIDSRYKINTAHMTILRFQHALSNEYNAIEKIEEFLDYNFGSLEIRSLFLVYNDWYQRSEIVKDLATFELK